MSNTKHPIFSFPKTLEKNLAALKYTNGMTPTILSDYIGSSLMYLATLTTNDAPPKQYFVTDFSTNSSINKTHCFNLMRERKDTLAQTLTASLKENKINQQHQIYFAGNAQDALSPKLVEHLISENQDKNHIFWDYPGESRHIGVNRFYLFIKAGYQQVKKILDGDVHNGKPPVPAKNITIRGYSMGGGIATAVARKLHDEGYPVHLSIDRSFSSLSAVLSPLLYHLLEKQYDHYLPLGSSVVAFSVLGVSLGSALAGIIATLGTITASLIAMMGYGLNSLISRIPGSTLIVKTLNAFFNSHAEYLNSCFNIAATIIGTAVSSIGLLAGAVLGAATGLVLSLQLLFTKTPYNISLEPATRCLLKTTTGEIDSVQNIKHILNLTPNKSSKISIFNSREDEVIREEAALATGLDCIKSTRYPKLKSYQNLDCQWGTGSHYSCFNKPNTSPEQAPELNTSSAQSTCS
ncbi:MAG: hypothetical protein K0U24_04145 [Gammaproteobacteria bacterium]|nr:hypothetical protein [Gammaproteobacteria bacterium]MCH9763405.1 hypothetical protein [Gammaproteobacteria bacterium]